MKQDALGKRNHIVGTVPMLILVLASLFQMEITHRLQSSFKESVAESKRVLMMCFCLYKNPWCVEMVYSQTCVCLVQGSTEESS